MVGSDTNSRSVIDSETEMEFERLLKTYSNRLSPGEVIKNMDAIKRQAREHALGRKLLLNEARRLKFEVSDDEIRTAIERITRRFGGEAGFLAHMEEQGLNPETLRERLRNARMIEKLVESVTADIAEPAEDEVLAYFNKHRGEFAEAAGFEQVKAIIATAIANERRNDKLLDYIERLKTTLHHSSADSG